MTKDDLNTEQKILEAAKSVFIVKGLEGARMQEIADEAGINKALLHYYYRTKDKLFEAVFREAFYKLVPNIVELLKTDMPLFDKIRHFVKTYIDIFFENPFIPGFVLHELSRNPQRIVNLISNIGIEPKVFADQINEEVRLGKIKPIDPYQLIVNMLAMCIFPFAATPIIKNIIFKSDEKSFHQFMLERKDEVPEFIINSIKNE
ncbi:MAG: TetR/AcrR family transcriptional regulator [Bacteroidales bacterium]|nr:TetR/AcrR family transcriptional regulator [Bacteroidales bacterium]